MKTLMRTTLAAVLVFGGAGCAILTEPKPSLDEFTYERIEREEDVNESFDVAGFFGDINFLGEVKTPTQCYTASAKLETDDQSITVHVDITSTGSGTCNQTPGGVRYAGGVRNLKPGTYAVKIIQNVGGVGTQEFTKNIKL